MTILYKICFNIDRDRETGARDLCDANNLPIVSVIVIIPPMAVSNITGSNRLFVWSNSCFVSVISTEYLLAQSNTTGSNRLFV